MYSRTGTLDPWGRGEVLGNVREPWGVPGKMRSIGSY